MTRRMQGKGESPLTNHTSPRAQDSHHQPIHVRVTPEGVLRPAQVQC